MHIWTVEDERERHADRNHCGSNVFLYADTRNTSGAISHSVSDESWIQIEGARWRKISQTVDATIMRAPAHMNTHLHTNTFVLGGVGGLIQ